MTKHKTIAILFFTLLGISAHAEQWWSSGWSHRRKITVSDGVIGSHPENVALVEFTTLGKARSDGGDFRVIDKSGKEMKIDVVSCGFDERVLIAFEAPYKGDYWVYFGNSAAPPSPHRTTLKTALILEVRERGDGDPKDWPAMKALLEKSPKVLGRWWVSNMNLAFNPLGPWDNGIFRFSGNIYCPTDGRYMFQANATDASFILIDGNVIADWPGWQGGRRPGHNPSFELHAGIHSIEYVYAFSSMCSCLVGWSKPGDRGFVPIPPDAYAGCFVATAGAAERESGPAADFVWNFTDDLGMEGRVPTVVQFSARGGKSFRWSFGDGELSFEQAPLHVYLDAQVYTVTCAADGYEVTQKVRVQPTLGHRGKGYEQRIQQYARIIDGYSTEKLSPRACFEMGLICHEGGHLEAAARAFRAAYEKGFKARDGEEDRWIYRLFEMYRDTGKYDDALWVCDHIIQEHPKDQTAAQALNMKALILYDYQNQAVEAAACAKEVLSKYSNADTDYVRLAYIRMGAMALVKGEKERAKSVLEEAERSARWRKWKGDFDFTEGQHAIAFDQYMRQGEFEGAQREIDSWEWEKPTVILTGQTRYMRGRVYLGRKMYTHAVTEFDRALETDPQPAFGDDLLLKKAQALEALNRKDTAHECYQKLLKDYPESKLAGTAREKLK